LQKNVLDGVSESVLGALLLLKEHTYATVVDVDVTITRGYTCVTTRDLIRHEEDSVGSLYLLEREEEEEEEVEDNTDPYSAFLINIVHSKWRQLNDE